MRRAEPERKRVAWALLVRRRPVRLPLDYGMPLEERARRLLGARLAEHPQLGFLLDGRPVSALRLRALVEGVQP